MAFAFVDTIFEMLSRHELSADAGGAILADAIAPALMIGSPPGLFQWVGDYFRTTLTAAEMGLSDTKACKSAVKRVFELMASKDFDRMNALRLTGG